MVLNGKQRAFLRGLAHNLDLACQIGKAGVTPEVIKSLDEALEARELIKVSILDNCPMDVKEAAQIAAERARSNLVQIIGNKFVLYRMAKKPKIELK